MAPRIVIGWNASQTRGNHSGQHILDVVRALERNSAERHYCFRSRILGGAIDHIPLLQPGTLANRVLNGKPINPGCRAFGCFFAGSVVGVQHQAILCRLRGKDALLGSNVVFKAAVTVEMIRRDVENHGNVGMKLLGGFKLEAGDFEDRPGFVGAVVDERHNRNADVAADQRGQTASREDFAQQRGGGGFAVGAGDGERMALEEARGQFQFADDRQAEVA